MSNLMPIVMPKWGLSMEEGTVARWHFGEGDEVPGGAELADIETSKLLNTLEAKHPGWLLRIVCPEGKTVSCGALIAVFGDETSGSAKQIDAFVADFARHQQTDVTGTASSASSFRFATVDGLSLRYADMGEGDEAVLLLHGFGGDCGNWMFVQKDLAARYRTLALDLPGHGGSDKTLPGNGSIADLAAIVQNFIAKLGLRQLHVVGHSFGGAIAERLVRTNRTMFCSLTLISPLLPGVQLNSGFLHDFVCARRSRDMREVLCRLVANEASISAAMVDDVLKYKRLDGVMAALERLAEVAQQTAAEPAESQQLCGLVILGGQDRIIPLPGAETLAGWSNVEVIPTAGHMLHLEEATFVTELILAYLARS